MANYQPGLFEKYVKVLNWQKSDGDVPGHWRDRPPGERYLLSARWSTSRGLIDANSLLLVEKATDKQLVAELEDYVFNLSIDFPAMAAQSGQVLSQKSSLSKDAWRKLARSFVGRARIVSPEYTAGFDMLPRPPVGNYQPVQKFRPNWPGKPMPPHKEPDEDVPVSSLSYEASGMNIDRGAIRKHGNFWGDKPHLKDHPSKQK